ncbi:MAG: hypothetical protein QOG82_1714 [Actinomycetota bacterium]|jgi:hypothetical protein|nr:hypothetical protein [Actinomycetota bacterium]
MIFGVTIALAVILLALSRAHRDVGHHQFVDEWARAHALSLTPENRPMVGWYLRNARLLRTWGALGGLFVAPIGLSALGFDPVGFWGIWVFLGYLAGALYAELSLVRAADVERTASLVPRELAAYLPRRLVVAQRGLGVVIATGAVIAAVAPYGDPTPASPSPHRVGLLAAGLVGVVFMLGLERVQRWVVERPQPFTEPALVEADDAIRSQSVHSLAGSGLAVLLVLNSFIAWALANSDIQILRLPMGIVSAFGVPAALAVCLYYGHRAWRVRRLGAVAVAGTNS